MKFEDVRGWTFFDWIHKISAWQWNPRIATMIYEIRQDRDFPNRAGYDEIVEYLDVKCHVEPAGMECFEVLWAAYVAQVRGECWERPKTDGERVDYCEIGG